MVELWEASPHCSVLENSIQATVLLSILDSLEKPLKFLEVFLLAANGLTPHQPGHSDWSSAKPPNWSPCIIHGGKQLPNKWLVVLVINAALQFFAYVFMRCKMGEKKHSPKTSTGLETRERNKHERNANKWKIVEVFGSLLQCTYCLLFKSSEACLPKKNHTGSNVLVDHDKLSLGTSSGQCSNLLYYSL